MGYFKELVKQVAEIVVRISTIAKQSRRHV
jgi:hypothetical protein